MGRRRGEGTLGEKAAVGHSLGTQGRWSCQKRWAGLGICISQFCLLRFRPPVLHGMQQRQRNPWLQRALGSLAGVRQMREELGPASLPSEPWGWRRHGTSSLAPSLVVACPQFCGESTGVQADIPVRVCMALAVAWVSLRSVFSLCPLELPPGRFLGALDEQVSVKC